MPGQFFPPSNCTTKASYSCPADTIGFRDNGAVAQFVVILFLLVFVLVAWATLTRESKEHIGQ